jgi:LysM repeat protein
LVDGGHYRGWVARLLAPVAFFAAVTVLVLVVRDSLDDEPVETIPVAVETQPAADTGAAAAPAGPKRFYRVRPGDTLESIAEKYDTTVPDLLVLNPDIDPLALRPDQRIRVQ